MAALQATQDWAPYPALSPSSSLPSSALSPLLGQLVGACRRLWLCEPHLAAPEAAPFLQLLKPQHLIASAGSTHSPAVDETLAACPALLRLECDDGLVPRAFPPHLQVLSVDLSDASRVDVQSLLDRLKNLPSLVKLHLRSCFPEWCVPEHWSPLPSLRKLSFGIKLAPYDPICNLQALREAAAQGVAIALDVELWDTAELEGDDLSPECRQDLWAALTELPPLESLRLQDVHAAQWRMPFTATEEELLASIACDELILHGPTCLASPVSTFLRLLKAREWL